MKTKRLTSNCISCLTKTQLDKHPENISEEKKLEYKQRALKILAEADWCDSAPLLVNRLDKLRIEMFGKSTDYTDIKHYFNSYVMEKAQRITDDIVTAEDSLLRALQYSMTGNYIDFGTMANVKEEQFEDLLSKAKDIVLDEKEYQNLKSLKSSSVNVYFSFI